MADYYQILGVERGASPDEIKQAYRRRAGLYHPDREGGSKTKFQELQQAYSVLSDPSQRAQYDHGGRSSGFSDSPGSAHFDFQSIFDMFGSRFGGMPGAGPAFRQTARMSLWITLEDTARGGRRTVSLGSQYGTTAVEIDIPQGINDGDTVQYSGLGPQGMDLQITFRVHPNPRWQRQGQNLIMDLSVSVWNLILGTQVKITDILGRDLELTVPPGTQPNSMLRLRGRGLERRDRPTGDLIIRVQAQIPTDIEPELLEMIRQTQSKSL